MSVFKRGKRWAAVAYEPGTGKRLWLGSFDTKGEARDAYDQTRQRLKRGRYHSETISEFADRWMDDYPRTAESTTLHYRQQIRALVRDFGHLTLAQIDRPTARRWALDNRSSWQAARAMFSDACRDDLCEANPFTNMRIQSGRGRRDLVVPTEAEVTELVAHAAKVHKAWGERVYGPLIQFAAYTGCRPGELFGLDWRHVDRRGQTVHVERQWNPKLKKMTKTKNGRARTIYLTPPAAEALDRLPDTGSALFLSPTGSRMGGQTSHYYWHPVRCSFGRPDLDFYSLRHYFGTVLALLGLGAPEIAQAMGHTDGGKLALTTYIHATEQDSRAKIAAAFARPNEPGEVRPLRNTESWRRAQ